MALNKQILVDGIYDLSFNFPPNQAVAMQRWSDLYVNYASGAAALDAIPALAANKPLLLAVFLKSAANFSFLADMGVNLTAFWLAPPIVFAGALNNGPVSGVSGAALLSEGLVKSSAEALSTGSSAVQSMATLLHGFTQTVLVGLINSAGAAVPTLVS